MNVCMARGRLENTVGALRSHPAAQAGGGTRIVGTHADAR